MKLTYLTLFMCYLLYLHTIGEDTEFLQNSHSKLFHIQGCAHNRRQGLPVFCLHTWVAKISDHRQLKENTLIWLRQSLTQTGCIISTYLLSMFGTFVITLTVLSLKLYTFMSYNTEHFVLPTLCFMTSTFSLRYGATLLRGRPFSSWLTYLLYLLTCELNCSRSSCCSVL